jgi:hypothetical protein
MPRPFGGKRCEGPAPRFDWRRVGVSHLVVLSTALLLTAASPGRAADEISDINVADSSFDEDSFGPAGASGNGGGLTVEGLVWWRSGLTTVPFTEAGEGGTSYVTFGSSDLEGDEYTPGLRMSLHAAVLDQPIELSAFFVAPFSFDRTKLEMNAGTNDTDAVYANPLPSEIFNGAPASGDSDNIYGMSAHLESKLYGGEANATDLLGIPGLSVGVRGIYFGEVLSTNTLDDTGAVTTPTPSGSTGAQDRDRVTVRTDNRLVGLQLGLEQMFNVGDALRIGGSIKGGLYNNFVDRNRTFVSEKNQGARAFEATDHDNVFAQAVEFNPRIELKLAEGTYLSAAGQFLWLNNVSSALPNYGSIASIHSDHDVRADDDAFFYGGSLGLTVLLDETSPISNSLLPFEYGDPEYAPASIEDVDARVTEMEESAARTGNEKVTLAISGWVSRMALFWDDGGDRDVYLVNNVASRTRVAFSGATKISRGLTAGYFLSLGFDDSASNDVNQFITDDNEGVQLRHSAWWIRSSQFGTATLGLTSTATDNIILKDVGGIMPGSANIATIGGSFIVRRADRYDPAGAALVTNGVDTTLNDFAAGASVDTLRRNIIRYDAPRLRGLWGNVDMSVAWGEDDFFDAAVEHGINYRDWKFRFGAGYLHDTSEARFDPAHPEYFRDRREYKGSASILHIPTGLFATAAYVHRTFHGLESTDSPAPGTVYGENTAGIVTPPGTNRPPIDYLYSAFGLRRQYWSIGDTSMYGEYAQVEDAITGLHEARMSEVTDSSLQMFGAAICQDIDDAAMDVYAGFRIYKFDAKGAVAAGSNDYISPVPIADMMFAYTGARIKF